MFKRIVLSIVCVSSLSHAMEETSKLSLITKAAISLNTVRLVKLALENEKSSLENAYQDDRRTANAHFDRRVEQAKWLRNAPADWLERAYAELNENLDQARATHQQRLDNFNTVVLPGYLRYAHKIGESPACSHGSVIAQIAGLSVLTSMTMFDLCHSIASGNIAGVAVDLFDIALFSKVGITRTKQALYYEEYVEDCNETNRRIYNLIAASKIELEHLN